MELVNQARAGMYAVIAAVGKKARDAEEKGHQ